MLSVEDRIFDLLQQLLDGQAAMRANLVAMRESVDALNANLHDFKTAQLAHNLATDARSLNRLRKQEERYNIFTPVPIAEILSETAMETTTTEPISEPSSADTVDMMLQTTVGVATTSEAPSASNEITNSEPVAPLSITTLGTPDTTLALPPMDITAQLLLLHCGTLLSAALVLLMINVAGQAFYPFDPGGSC